MTKWQIKEMSEMCNISTRMLRHYDKIGLLPPSYRLSNGYRCYTQQDLAKLQQIIALKFLGFELKTIKEILLNHGNVYAHLQAQFKTLQQQVESAKQLNDLLEDILQSLCPSETPNWKILIQLIERYQKMGNLRETLKQSWAGQALSEKQFEEYLALYEKFPQEFNERDRIIKKINNDEYGDPKGDDGLNVAQFMLDLARKTKQSFSKNIKFSSSVMQSVQSGKITQLELSTDGIVWLQRAMNNYWMNRWNSLYEKIVDNTKLEPSGEQGRILAQEWKSLIDEYFSVGSRSFLTGILLWNDLARQQAKLQQSDVSLTTKEMVNQYQLKLLFNPEATSWISQALEIHGG